VNRISLVSVGVLALSWIAVPAAASPPTTQLAAPSPSASSAVPPPAPEGIDETLNEAFARPPGLLKYGPVSILDRNIERFNEAAGKIGLNIGFAYTAAYQAASGGPGIRSVAGGDVDLFGNWRLLDAWGKDYAGYLYFAAEQRHTLWSDIPPGSLGGQIGSLWGTTNGFSEQPLLMKELFWQQHFGGDHLLVRVGKLDPENYYNTNYWQSDSRYFMNAAFSSFPVRSFPGQGLGVNVTAALSDAWYISTGFQDAQGQKSTAGFNTFFEDFNLFSAFEVGYEPNIEGLGAGTYRFTAWYRDHGESNGKPHDAGFDVSFDQHVGEHLIPFFRAGIGEGKINGIDDMISGGIGWEGALLTKADVFGIGGGWGRPSDHHLRDQYVTELFYRLQVSPDNQLTAGYQIIFNPSNDPHTNVVGVFELRWRISM
jgi:porin